MNLKPFRLTVLDDELSTRMSQEEFSRIMALRNHPLFLNGLTAYAELIPDYFADNIILNRVVTEVWRFEMLVFALYLYDTRAPDEPRSGLTVANLQKLCREQNCASPGRVFAILGIMRLGGYLKQLKLPSDHRVVQLQPSEAFIDIVEGWNARLLQIIDSILPDEDLAGCHSLEPRFGWVMRRRGAEGLIKGWRLLPPFAEVSHFVTSDGGWMLLLTCVSLSLTGPDRAHIQPVSLDLKQFGKRFGVSRSHLRRLLESAYAEGLLDAPPKNGSAIMLSEKLIASFLACMASELGYYLAQSRAAKSELELTGNSITRDS